MKRSRSTRQTSGSRTLLASRRRAPRAPGSTPLISAACIVFLVTTVAFATSAGCGSGGSGTGGPDATANETGSGGQTSADSQITLRDLAERRGFQIGAAPLLSPYEVPDPRYSRILSGQFNRIVLEGFSWNTIRLSRDTFDFDDMDTMVEYGLSHKMEIEGHHLTWGAYEHLPAWLKDGGFSREQLIEILHEHVTAVVSRYRGKVKTWSVANEVADRARIEHGDFWHERIGPEYVGMVFTWAREADPGATLILNQGVDEDRSVPERQQISDDTYNLISQLKQSGVPVDGVGMQMHIMGVLSGDQYNPPKKEDVLANMKRFAGLGVSIYVTEFDVNMSNIEGTRDERWALEARIYRDMLSACLESGACGAFSTFGFTDAVSWYNDCPGCLNIPDAEPLPYDAAFQPKPAWFAMRDVLAGP